MQYTRHSAPCWDTATKGLPSPLVAGNAGCPAFASTSLPAASRNRAWLVARSTSALAFAALSMTWPRASVTVNGPGAGEFGAIGLESGTNVAVLGVTTTAVANLRQLCA
jgi:hypothetical protein